MFVFKKFKQNPIHQHKNQSYSLKILDNISPPPSVKCDVKITKVT